MPIITIVPERTSTWTRPRRRRAPSSHWVTYCLCQFWADCTTNTSGLVSDRDTRLKSDLLYRKAKRLEQRNQGFGLARDLRLLHDFPLRVHNAHAREFQ